MSEKLSDEMYRYYSTPLVLDKAKAFEWIERVRALERVNILNTATTPAASIQGGDGVSLNSVCNDIANQQVANAIREGKLK